ncbi:MAG: pyrimidine reductase family protein [Geodermatophilaceae bacterium]|nr:pyrimidine reductase family protein [Geodermatophilaceae bacterium]
MRRLFPPATELLESDALDDEALEQAYSDEPADFVRINFVASADGASSLDGRAGGLGSATDQQVLRLLRDRSDGILVGAGTARAEGYRPLRDDPVRSAARMARGLARVAPMILVSQRLSVEPSDPIIARAVARTVIVTCANSDPERREALAAVTPLIVAGEQTVDLAAARTALAGRGLRRLVCEGGPTLFGTALAAGIVDELCLTISPMLTGPGAGRIIDGHLEIDPVRLRLRHLLEEDGYFFLRYSLDRPRPR